MHEIEIAMLFRIEKKVRAADSRLLPFIMSMIAARCLSVARFVCHGVVVAAVVVFAVHVKSLVWGFAVQR